MQMIPVKAIKTSGIISQLNNQSFILRGAGTYHRSAQVGSRLLLLVNISAGPCGGAAFSGRVCVCVCVCVRARMCASLHEPLFF